MIVERRGILTVPGEMSERCWGKRIPEIQDKHLRDALLGVAREFIRKRKLEGDEFVERDDIHIYGPFPSMVMLEAMLDSESMAITAAEHNQIVRERGESPDAFAHYLLNANFMVRGESPAPKE